MKTIQMTREFVYQPKDRVAIRYLGGATYDRVPEFAARAIVAAGAGYAVEQSDIMRNLDEQFGKVFE